MKKYLFIAGTAALMLLTAWHSMPWWMPALINRSLPPGLRLTITSPLLWRHGLQNDGFRLSVGECVLLDVGDIALSRAEGRWRLNVAQATFNSDCLAQLPQDSTPTTPPSLAQWQQRMFAVELNIARLTLQPWDRYAGQAQLIVDAHQQRLRYRGEQLSLDAVLQGPRLTLEQGEITAPDSASRLVLSGEGELADAMTFPPTQGALRGRMDSATLPDPVSVALTWHGDQGELSLEASNSETPLVSLPWQLTADTLRIENGRWRWPYAAQPLSGQLSMTLQHWRQGLDQTRIDARVNMLTEGHNGKANAVLVLGPGQLGLIDSALRFQLTGQANLSDISISASVPGEIQGSIINPTVAVLPGALLRAWGTLAPQVQLEEARWPLAGLRVNANGVNGRLQAIVRASDRYWGRFALHLDGQAQDFWPDRGRWQWRYWGAGQLPPLAGQWDVAGRGRWEDTLISVEQLSSGFNQLQYGHVAVRQPRLTLTAPLNWQRQRGAEHFSGALQMTAQQVNFGDGGYLPPSLLALTVAGRAPDDFQWQGALNAEMIGPVTLRGRWDGERLRGMGWWPAQPLSVFQPLLSPRLEINLRDGEFYAQTAFSAARGQGFSAGGHWVVKQGSAWLPDGEVRGVNVILPYRFEQHRWEFGVKHPVALRIDKLVSVFNMQDIRLDLQGYYPYSERRPLILSQAEMGIMRGKISLSALRWPVRDTVLFTLDHIDLSELVTALKIKQFALSGRVSGVLPLDFNNPQRLITRGRLRNDGFLTLRLDQQLADELARGSMANSTAMDWLRYLEISRAYAALDMTPEGALTLRSHIEGKNPARSAQKQVILNYRHSQDLYQLWRSLRFGGNVQDTLEQRANERQ